MRDEGWPGFVFLSPFAFRLSTLAERAASAEFGPEGEHEVEHHADAGEMLAWKPATRLVGIDDAGGGGQAFARQVVVGNQHRHTEAVGLRDPVDARDPVVDR